MARRTISLICPLLVLGLPLALSRFIPYAASRDSHYSERYYGATLWCLFGSVLLCEAMIALLGSEFAYLFFGAKSYASLADPISLILVGLAMHAVVYAYFRGNLAIWWANALQLVNYAFVPIIAFVGFGTSVRSVLHAWGLGTIMVAAVGLLCTPWRRAIRSANWVASKELLVYGIQRIPGGLALLALMTLPATLAAHLVGIAAAGFVAFGISLLGMTQTLFSPITLVLLPKASRLCADGEHEALRAHVLNAVKYAMIVALSFTIGFELLGGVAIQLYIGPDFARVASIARVVAIGALPFALFYVLQGLVDAYHTKAVNTLNCIRSLGVFLIACIPCRFYDPIAIICGAFLLGIFTLGFLTVRESRRILAVGESGQSLSAAPPSSWKWGESLARNLLGFSSD